MKANDGIHTAVVPPGAIGLALAACLPRGLGDRLTVISRSHSALVRDYGLGLFGVAGNQWRLGDEFDVFDSLADVKIPINRLLVPAPTFSMGQIANEIAKCSAITEKTSIIQFNNGWLYPNPITQVLPARQVYNGVLMVGCLRRSPNVTQVTVNAGIMIGSLDGAPLEVAEDLADALSRGGLPSHATSDIGQQMWRKLGFNSVAALSAPYRMALGGLLRPEFAPRVERVALEVRRASIDVGHMSFITESEAVEDVFTRIRTAAVHTASITHALWNRQKTEISSLCGVVARIGEANGWYATECTRICEEILAIETDNHVEADSEFRLAGAA